MLDGREGGGGGGCEEGYGEVRAEPPRRNARPLHRARRRSRAPASTTWTTTSRSNLAGDPRNHVFSRAPDGNSEGLFPADPPDFHRLAHRLRSGATLDSVCLGTGWKSSALKGKGLDGGGTPSRPSDAGAPCQLWIG